MSSEESDENSIDSDKNFDLLQPGFDEPECDPYRFIYQVITVMRGCAAWLHPNQDNQCNTFSPQKFLENVDQRINIRKRLQGLVISDKN